MVAVALVPGDETDLAAGEHVLKDGLSANFIVHAQKNSNAMTAFVVGMFEQLQRHSKGWDHFRNTMQYQIIILYTISSSFHPSYSQQHLNFQRIYGLCICQS